MVAVAVAVVVGVGVGVGVVVAVAVVVVVAVGVVVVVAVGVAVVVGVGVGVVLKNHMSSTKPSRRNRIELLPTPDERRIIDRMHDKANKGKTRMERISMSRFVISLVLSGNIRKK